MNVYCGWAARTLAASHAACGAQRGSTTPALRSPLDPCQRARILRLDNDAIQEPPPGTGLRPDARHENDTNGTGLASQLAQVPDQQQMRQLAGQLGQRLQ